MSKLGLVLSGGGAKGAYHVGVIRALQELGIQFDMLSGASIGALNGAVLLSAQDQIQGLIHLEKLWDKLSHVNPLQIKGIESINDFIGLKKNIGISTYLGLLIASGLRLTNPIGIASSFLTLAYGHLHIKSLEGFCKQEPLSEMMEEFFKIEYLNESIPFYISTYKIKDHEHAIYNFIETLKSAKDFLKAEFLGLDNSHSDFYKIQDLAIDDQKSFILASAALPLIFLPQRDGKGSRLIDGGLGGALKSQGNTPITPLIDAGCTHIIVSHLDHGSLWHRHDYPDVSILEIRPNQNLDLSFSKLFDFSKDSIETLRNQGYVDTRKEMERVLGVLSSFIDMNKNSDRLNNSLTSLSTSEDQLNDIMKRF